MVDEKPYVLSITDVEEDIARYNLISIYGTRWGASFKKPAGGITLYYLQDVVCEDGRIILNQIDEIEFVIK